MVASEQYDLVIQGTTISAFILASKRVEKKKKVLVLLSREHAKTANLYSPRTVQALYSLRIDSYMDDKAFPIDRSCMYHASTQADAQIHRYNRIENPVRTPGYMKWLGKKLQNQKYLRVYTDIRDIHTKHDSVRISYGIPQNKETQLIRTKQFIVTDTSTIPSHIWPRSMAITTCQHKQLQLWEYKGEQKADVDDSSESMSERYYADSYVLHAVRNHTGNIQVYMYAPAIRNFTPDALDSQGEAWLRDRIQQRQESLTWSEHTCPHTPYTLPLEYRGIWAVGSAYVALQNPILQAEQEICQAHARYMHNTATLIPNHRYSQEQTQRAEEYQARNRKISFIWNWHSLPWYRSLGYRSKKALSSLISANSHNDVYKWYAPFKHPAVPKHSSSFQERYPSLAHMAPWHRSTDVTWRDGIAFYQANRLGARAPYALVTTKSNYPQRNWQELLRTQQWTVLLFDGIYSKASVSMQELLEERNNRYTTKNKIIVYRITTQYQDALHDSIDQVRGDPHARMHQSFLARKASIYVIRPDGHIQAKACGTTTKYQIQTYLDRLESPA